VKFEWTSKCEETFQKLKDILKSEPILEVVDPNKYFLVCNERLSGVLSEKGHVVCYESRTLK
jgi:hypothetical protein